MDNKRRLATDGIMASIGSMETLFLRLGEVGTYRMEVISSLSLSRQTVI